MTPFDKEIWYRISHGDENAFEIVYKGYYSSLSSYAYDLIRSKTIAEEIIQEIMIKLWENRSLIEIKTSLKAYLYRCVHNRCINYLKQEQVANVLKNKFVEDVFLNNNHVLSIEQEYPMEKYLYDGIEKDFEAAISSLPDQCRVIFRMSRYELLSYEEIAAKLNISKNTVKTQMRRALEKIRIIITRRSSDQAFSEED